MLTIAIRIYGTPSDRLSIKTISIGIIKEALAGLPKMDIGEESVGVFFVPDYVEEGLGEEIVIFIDELTRNARDSKDRDLIARVVSEILKNIFPTTPVIKCRVQPLGKDDGFYSIEDAKTTSTE